MSNGVDHIEELKELIIDLRGDINALEQSIKNLKSPIEESEAKDLKVKIFSAGISTGLLEQFVEELNDPKRRDLRLQHASVMMDNHSKANES